MSENTAPPSIFVPIVLSAFGLPGAGHWYLKKTKSAALYIVITLGSLAVMFGYIYAIVRDVINTILANGSPLNIDVDQIRTLTYQALSEQSETLLKVAVIVFCVTWVVAILDIIRMRYYQ